MTKPVRTDRETGLRAELAHNEIDRGAREASAFAGAVKIDEERSGFGAADREPRLQRGLQLRKLSARQWFERADDLRRDYPKGFDSWGYEWVPSQCVAIDALQYSVGAKAVVVFADYVTPGSHRAVLDAHQPFRLDLEREGFVLGEWGGGKPEERCVE
jgi:hypothetical protein